jgi:hypothetical protein
MRASVFFLFILLLARAPEHAQAQSSHALVSETVQRARDNERRSILENELLDERSALALAQEKFELAPSAEQSANLHRHTENIKALLRELSSIAEQPVSRTPRIKVRVARRPEVPRTRVPAASGSFWNPYNRVIDPTDSSMFQRKEAP